MKLNLFQPIRSNTAQTYSPFWTVTVLALLAMLILGVGGIYHTSTQLKAVQDSTGLKAKDIEQTRALLTVRTELNRKQAEIRQLETRLREMAGNHSANPDPRAMSEAIAAQAESLQLAGFAQQLDPTARGARLVLEFSDSWADFTGLMDWLQEQGWCRFIRLVAVRQTSAVRTYEVILEVPAT